MWQLPQGLKPEDILIYLRKSRSDDPVLSVEEVLLKHEKMLDDWVERNLPNLGRIPESNRFREVVSGETIESRPVVQEVLRLMESPKYKAVLIVEPQRLSRGDLEDIGRTMKLLKHTNTLVFTIDRMYDLRDEYDWEALERELKRGNEYLEYYKKIQMRGRLLSVSQGNYLGSIPPYGFDKTMVVDGKRECPTLKENPEQAEVVRTVFDLFVNQDMGRRRIANYLNAAKIAPPKTGHWSASGIREILTNVHHIGKVRWNWRKWVVMVEEGEFVKTRPVANVGEYLIYEGRHDGIVDEELFNAAQEKIGRCHRAKRDVEVRNPLASLMFCKNCGRAIVYRRAKGDRKADISASRFMCSEQGYCDTGSCPYDDIIGRVCDVLADCIEDFEIRLKNDAGNSAQLHAKLIKQLEKKMEELQAKELSQWEAQSDPDPAKRMPQEIFQQLNARLLKEKEEVRQALCEAYESMPEPVDYSEKVVMFRDALAALQDPDVDAQKKNALLKQCIERIEYYRPKMERINGVWSDPPIELDIKLKI